MYATSGGTAKGVFEITHHNFDSTASSLLLGSTNNLCKPSFVRSLIRELFLFTLSTNTCV